MGKKQEFNWQPYLRALRFVVLPIVSVLLTLILPAYHIAVFIAWAITFICTTEGGPCQFSMVRPFLWLGLELFVFGLKINGII